MALSFKRVLEEEQKKPRKIINFDFTEVDEIRKLVRETVKRIAKPITTRKKKAASYDRTTFYIGRNVANLTFHNLYVSEFQVRIVVKELKKYYTHDIYQIGRTLHIYMRGKKRS